MTILFHMEVPSMVEAERLSDFLIDKIPPLPSRKSVKKAIKKGAILVNNEIGQTGTWINGGEIIQLVELDRAPSKIHYIEFPVVLEDDHLAIVQKPGGIPVSGNQFRTLENALPHNLKPSNLIDAYVKMRPVHRLDAPTAGLLLIAKTRTAHAHLAQQFEQKTIEKTYHAVVIGKTPTAGIWNSEVDGKSALTHFKTLKTSLALRNHYLSLLELKPQTGRTHQLRLHCSSAGFPILGDKLYGQKGEILLKKGLFLAAVRLVFEHPISGERMDIAIDAPAKFELFMEREFRRWKEFNL